MSDDDFLALARDALLGDPPPASLDDALARLEQAVRGPRPVAPDAPLVPDPPAQELAPEENGE